MGWLGCRRVESRPGSPRVLRKRGHHPAFARDEHQVLHAHQLGDRGGHLGGDAGSDRCQHLGGGLEREEPVAEITHGEMRQQGEGAGVVVACPP